MTSIPTYTGSVQPDALGMTLLHEHVFVGDPELDRALPHPEWDEQGAIRTAVATLAHLHSKGVRSIVDLTVPGLGRDVQVVARVAEQSPVNIVAATGWYSVRDLPPGVRSHGPGTSIGGLDPLEQLFIADIEHGIQGTTVRAGVIKVASDQAGMSADVRRVFRAAARAHLRSGVTITTHSHPGTQGGLEQQRALQALGVPLERVVIGHSGDSTDIDYLRRIADRGSYLGFDRFGMEHVLSDSHRISTLIALLELGYADRIVLSHDAAIFSRVTPPSWRCEHTPHWHMAHLPDVVLPQLRAAGVSSTTIEQMLITTPRLLLEQR